MLRRYLETIRKAKVVINKLRCHIKELGLTCDFSVRVQSVLSSLSVNADSKKWFHCEFGEMFTATHHLQQETQTHNAGASSYRSFWAKCVKVFLKFNLYYFLLAVLSLGNLNIPYLYQCVGIILLLIWLYQFETWGRLVNTGMKARKHGHDCVMLKYVNMGVDLSLDSTFTVNKVDMQTWIISLVSNYLKTPERRFGQEHKLCALFWFVGRLSESFITLYVMILKL